MLDANCDVIGLGASFAGRAEVVRGRPGSSGVVTERPAVISAPMSTTFAASHYDRVTAAWRLLMGEAFHYGVFAPGEGPAALDRATARLNEAMLAQLGPVSPGERVLDVGCGVGGPARWLAARTGARIHGISTSATGIAAAIEAAAEVSPPGQATSPGGLSFAVADAQENGLPDAEFAVAWIMESSHLMPQKARMIAECARILRPGGRLVLCDLVFRAPLDLAEMLDRRRDLLCLDRVFGRARIESPDAYLEMVRTAGFTETTWRDLSAETAPTLTAWGERLAAHRVEVDALLGAEAAADFGRACEILAELWATQRMGYFVMSARRAT